MLFRLSPSKSLEILQKNKKSRQPNHHGVRKHSRNYILAKNRMTFSTVKRKWNSFSQGDKGHQIQMISLLKELSCLLPLSWRPHMWRGSEGSHQQPGLQPCRAWVMISNAWEGNEAAVFVSDDRNRWLASFSPPAIWMPWIGRPHSLPLLHVCTFPKLGAKCFIDKS